MDNNKIVTEKQEKKKRNKLVGWFLDLPKWGKGLLIGGTVAVIATAITVPVVLTMNKGSGGVQVSEADFNSIIKYFTDWKDADNRNFIAELKDCEQKSGSESIKASGKIEVNKESHYCEFTTTEDHNIQKSLRENNICYIRENNIDAAKHDEFNIDDKDRSSDYSTNISMVLELCDIKYSDTTFKNGVYVVDKKIPNNNSEELIYHFEFTIAKMDGVYRLKEIKAHMPISDDSYYNADVEFKSYNKSTISYKPSDFAERIDRTSKPNGSFESEDIKLSNNFTIIFLHSEDPTATNNGKWTANNYTYSKYDVLSLYDSSNVGSCISCTDRTDDNVLNYKESEEKKVTSADSIIVATFQNNNSCTLKYSLS